MKKSQSHMISYLKSKGVVGVKLTFEEMKLNCSDDYYRKVDCLVLNMYEACNQTEYVVRNEMKKIMEQEAKKDG